MSEDIKNTTENTGSVKERTGSSGSWVSALIIGICVVLSAAALAAGLYLFRSNKTNTIAATGSASVDFTSDLVVWSGSFRVYSTSSKDAYTQIQRDADKVRDFLRGYGITSDEVLFKAVSISEVTHNNYDENGNYVNSLIDGYNLSQYIEVTSSDIDKVERVSREVSQLIASGIDFNSYSCEYYYTKLDDLKLDLIEKATTNAKERISIIARVNNANLGKLTGSSLGVFQITARNSGTGSYSYDGAFDTSSRDKTASVTVRLEYELH